MPAHTVLLLPAGAMIGFWESSRCAAAAVVPDSSTHHETIHHAGDAGITLYRDHLPIDVDLVCSNGAPALAGCYLVDMLHTAVDSCTEKH